MSGFKFDTSKPGLRKTLREYEELTLRHIWYVGEEGAASGSTWETVNIQLGPGNSISRASVIFALNRFVDQGVLGWRDATGKGGHHKIYYPLMDEKGFKVYVARTVIQSLMRDFPEETREVIRELGG